MTGNIVHRGGQGTEECRQKREDMQTGHALLSEWEERRKAGGRMVFAEWVKGMRKIKDSGVLPVGEAVTDRAHITQ